MNDCQSLSGQRPSQLDAQGRRWSSFDCCHHRFALRAPVRPDRFRLSKCSRWAACSLVVSSVSRSQQTFTDKGAFLRTSLAKIHVSRWHCQPESLVPISTTICFSGEIDGILAALLMIRGLVPLSVHAGCVKQYVDASVWHFWLANWVLWLVIALNLDLIQSCHHHLLVIRSDHRFSSVPEIPFGGEEKGISADKGQVFEIHATWFELCIGRFKVLYPQNFSKTLSWCSAQKDLIVSVSYISLFTHLFCCRHSIGLSNNIMSVQSHHFETFTDREQEFNVFPRVASDLHRSFQRDRPI